MKGNDHRTLAGMALLCALSAAVYPAVADKTEENVGFVAAGDKLPNDLVQEKNQVARVEPLLKDLSEGHRLKVEVENVPRSTTGYDHDIRYVRQVTTVDAKGRPDGREVTYRSWSGGPARTATFEQGVQQGMEKHFDPRKGVLTVEIPWKNGKIHGVKRRFFPSGKVASETTYEKGLIHGTSRTFDEQGNVTRTAEFLKGERHGKMIDYWPDNPEVTKQTVPYHKGKVDGVAQAFYLNGKPKWERPFKNNRRQGVEKHYAGDGSVERIRFWLDGREVPAETYRRETGDKNAGK